MIARRYRCCIGWIVVCFMVCCVACGHGDSNVHVDSEAEADLMHDDVAMIVSSMVDAVNFGEQLDGKVYDYHGILTDGRGQPLYTAMKGGPGEWVVDVTGPGSAVVRNVDLGDLLPDDLRVYVVTALGMSDRDIVGKGFKDADDEVEEVVYSCHDSMLRFETRYETASNGREGAWVSIYIDRMEE